MQIELDLRHDQARTRWHRDFAATASAAGNGGPVDGEARDAEVSPGPSPTVLVVEDDDDVRAIVEELLADHGYHVLSARNGREAVVYLESSERIDLLFTDVVMPGGMNGRDVAAAAARLRPNLRVLYTSGYLGHSLAGSGSSALAPHPFLAKPYRPTKLLETVKTLIGR